MVSPLMHCATPGAPCSCSVDTSKNLPGYLLMFVHREVAKSVD
jgi:hypothetical protein